MKETKIEENDVKRETLKEYFLSFLIKVTGKYKVKQKRKLKNKNNNNNKISKNYFYDFNEFNH